MNIAMNAGNRAYSIAEWAELNNVSIATYYRLRRLGKAPRTIEVGARRIITEASNSEWREKMMAPEPSA